MKKFVFIILQFLFFSFNGYAQKAFDIKGTFGFDFKTPKQQVLKILKDSNAIIEEDFSDAGKIFYSIKDYSTISEFENITIPEIQIGFKKSNTLAIISIREVDMFIKYRDILKSWIKRAVDVAGEESDSEMLLKFTNCKILVSEDHFSIYINTKD